MICPKCQHEFSPKTRSVAQNNAYFGIAVEKLARQSNVSKEVMHKALAGEFLGYDTVIMNGKEVKIAKSTTGLSTKEFSDYYARIQRYAAENGLDIPDPNEQR